MSQPVKIPSVGESVSEVEIGAWRKGVGDAVEKDEELVSLETDKASVELPSPARGVLVEIRHAQGDTVKVGSVIAMIDEAAAAGAAPAPPAKARAQKGAGAAAAPQSARAGGQDQAQPGEEGASAPPGSDEQPEAEAEQAEAEVEPEAEAEQAEAEVEPEAGAEQAEAELEPEREAAAERAGTAGEVEPAQAAQDDPEAAVEPQAEPAAQDEQAEVQGAAEPQAEEPAGDQPDAQEPPSEEAQAAQPEGEKAEEPSAPGEDGERTAELTPQPKPAGAKPAGRPATAPPSKPGPAPKTAAKPQRAPKPGAKPPVAADEADVDLVPLSRLRRTIARRLVEAQHTAALLTTFNEIDLSAVQELRAQHGPAFEERYGVRLGLMSFFVKAAIAALQEVPELNAELRGEEIAYHRRHHIGIAVGSGAGLVVPVLRDADRLSFAAVETAIADLAERAQHGRLELHELQGGTFTLTNGGVYGSLLSTPIVNPPQSGILGMHAIEDRPVARAGQVVIRPMMYVALTYDHRLIDGREAVTFLRRVKELVETPARLLLEA